MAWMGPGLSGSRMRHPTDGGGRGARAVSGSVLDALRSAARAPRATVSRPGTNGYPRRVPIRRAAPEPAPDWFACPVCGSEVRVGALVCRECGADERVGWGDGDSADLGTAASGVVVPDTYEEFERLTRRSRTRRVLTAVLVAVLVVLLAVAVR